MHVGGERRWRRAPRQPALLLADFGQGQPEPAELLRHRRKQIFGLAQLVEILVEKPVLTVVTGSPLRATLQQIVGQQRTDRRGHSAHPVMLFGFWRSPRSRPDLIPTLDRAASRPAYCRNRQERPGRHMRVLTIAALVSAPR